MSSSQSSCPRADIIDLDRYLRAGVRHARSRERLVVDAGGPERVPVGGSSTDSARRGPGRPERGKRYSHDSGLSDGSYVKRKHRPHRRISDANGKLRQSNKMPASSSSVQEFKAACEKALRDQQLQIERMAELCEKLAQPQTARNTNPNVLQSIGPNNVPNISDLTSNSIPDTNTNVADFAPVTSDSRAAPTAANQFQIDANANCVQNLYQNTNHICSGPNMQQRVLTKHNFGQNVSQNVGRRRRTTSDTSDVTSSSRSSGDGKRRDKHRTESCKTYNLIMKKLDELSRVFARRNAPVARLSSDSLSMRDKLVATDDNVHSTAPIVQVLRSDARRPALNAPREGQRASETRSIGQWSGSSDAETNNVHNYDLNDPLHLYAQAKRLQALHASARRTRVPPSTFTDKLGDKLDDRLSGSLCSLCRGYWRAFRRCLAQQLFGACS